MVFAGGTVTIALVSLAVANIPLVTTMGLMAAIAVVVAVLAAVTLLPATLAIVGPHINSLRVRGRHNRTHIPSKGLWARWASVVGRPSRGRRARRAGDPDPAGDPAAVVEPGAEGRRALSKSTTARQAYDQISQNFGAGVNGPLIVAVSLGSPAKNTSDSRLATLQKDVSQTHGVVAVTPMQLDKAGTTALLQRGSDQGAGGGRDHRPRQQPQRHR